MDDKAARWCQFFNTERCWSPIVCDELGGNSGPLYDARAYAVGGTNCALQPFREARSLAQSAGRAGENPPNKFAH